MKNAVKEIIMPIVVLTAICLFCSGALAVTFKTTQPVIAVEAAKEAAAARSDVYPNASEVVKLEGELPEGATEIYTVNGGEGYIITAVTKGFGGKIEVMTGLLKSGEILGIKVLSMDKETSGLGTQIGSEGYRAKYIGQSSVDDVPTIAGATVSSTAFKKLMQQVVAMPQKLGGAAK
ncbi:MAG: FMN-binding protein [Hydrogenoanaerobacterium sp.]